MTSYNTVPDPLLEPIIFDHKQDYLRRTIDVKNKNIEELIKELKETQELYQGIKNQYLGQERKMKNKISELSSQIHRLSGELEKERNIANRTKMELQSAYEKEHKMRENQIAQAQEFKTVMYQLEQKCKQLSKENNDLKMKNQNMLNKYVKLEQKCTKMESASALERQEIRQLRHQVLQNSTKWQMEKAQLLDKIAEQEEKKKQKMKINHKLDQIQQKILTNIKKI